MESLLERIIQGTRGVLTRWKTITLSEALAQLDRLDSISGSYATGCYTDHMSLFQPKDLSKQTFESASPEQVKDLLIPILVGSPSQPDWIKLAEYNPAIHTCTNIVARIKVTGNHVGLQVNSDDGGRYPYLPFKDYQKRFADFNVAGRLRRAQE